MARIVIIGNSGGGKSTLARKLASRRRLPYLEIDRLLWQDGWVLTPTNIYMQRHREIGQGSDWVIDRLGQQTSIPERIARATEIILVDMPVWARFWLAAERQIAWATGTLDQPPAGFEQMPPTEGLFRNMWDVDQNWIPTIRVLCAEAEADGKTVTRLMSVADLNTFAQTI
jgi:adenylate kinase family enzyme